MRGTSCAAMPMPVSATSMRTSRSSARALTVTRPARGRVLDRVVHQVGEHLPQPIAIAPHRQAGVDRGSDSDLFLVRHVLVHAHDFLDERRQAGRR